MSRPQTLGGVEKSASDTNTPKWVDLSHTSHTRGARFWYELNAQRDSRGRFSKLFAPKRGIHNARPWLCRKLLWDTYGPCAQSMEYLQEETTVGPTEFRGSLAIAKSPLLPVIFAMVRVELCAVHLSVP